MKCFYLRLHELLLSAGLPGSARRAYSAPLLGLGRNWEMGREIRLGWKDEAVGLNAYNPV